MVRRNLYSRQYRNHQILACRGYNHNISNFRNLGMYQCFVSAGGNGIGGGRNMAGIAAAGGYRQEAQASSELRLGGEKIYNITYFKLTVNRQLFVEILKYVKSILSNVAKVFENIYL